MRIIQPGAHLLSSRIQWGVYVKAVLPQATALTRDWIWQGCSGTPILWRQSLFWKPTLVWGLTTALLMSLSMQGILGLPLTTQAKGSPIPFHFSPKFPLFACMFNPILPSIFPTIWNNKNGARTIWRNRQWDKDLNWSTHHPAGLEDTSWLVRGAWGVLAQGSWSFLLEELAYGTTIAFFHKTPGTYRDRITGP